MDNLTHTLVGIALSRCFFKRRVAYATAAMIIAANAPDLDLLASGVNNIHYLAWHRDITHSVLALPVWALLIAVVLRWAAKRGRKEVPGWGISLALGLAGVGSHLLLDWTNAYGIRLLAPVRSTWYAGNLEPIVDPWIWALLLAFLLLPMVLNLVSREVGSTGSSHAVSAGLALALLVGWWGVRDWSEHRAEAVLERSLPFYQGQTPLESGVFPVPSSPFAWHGVSDFPDRYILTTVDARSGRIEYADPQQIVLKPQATPAIQRAEQTPAAGVFLQFARFPLAEMFRDQDGIRIFFTDLRFGQAGDPPEMGLTVKMNDALQVERTSFGWRRAGRDVRAAR